MAAKRRGTSHKLYKSWVIKKKRKEKKTYLNDHTYIFNKLCIWEHKKVIEDGVQAAVCGLGITDQAVQLLFNLMRLGQHFLGEVLEVEKKLQRKQTCEVKNLAKFHQLHVTKAVFP